MRDRRSRTYTCSLFIQNVADDGEGNDFPGVPDVYDLRLFDTERPTTLVMGDESFAHMPSARWPGSTMHL